MTLQTLTPSTEHPAAPRRFLPEVQALRALAVSLVVAYHFWPSQVSGGYVGVDVFFVISGFLITSHLLRELASRGTIALGAFYARRARRLLPAALLVLALTTAASWCWLPATRWGATAREVLASTFYAQNWLLATRSVDYSALNDAASPVQHFWSLAVEEQFYLVWPALVLVFALLSRRARSSLRHSLLLPGILAITTASLLCSVLLTSSNPAAAYFVTPTRVWELGAGAALASWTAARPPQERTPGPAAGSRAVCRWLGLAAVLGAAALYSAQSAFPGYLALLPVLGTVAVIAAGETGTDPIGSLLNSRPAQFLGNVSYSLYLWHWPVLVLAPFALARPVGSVGKVALIGLSIALAWATRAVVEAPTQRWSPLARPRSTAGLAAAAMTVVAGLAALQLHQVAQNESSAQESVAQAAGGSCFGAAALPARSACPDPLGPAVSVVVTPDDQPWFADPACRRTTSPITVDTCRFSSTPPTRRVALVGDSHAEQWRGALHQIARDRNWQLVEVLRGGCPATAARVLTFNGDPVDTDACRRWGQQVDRLLAADPPDEIITSAFASSYTFAPAGGGSQAAGAAGFRTTWAGWADLGPQVVVLNDVPTTGAANAPECVATHPRSPVQCAHPRSAALAANALTAAVRHQHSPHVGFVDLTDHFCDARTCYAVVGGAQVYADANHISAQFSRTLAPYLLTQLDRVLPGR